MAIRPILEVPDPRLREISKPVEGVDDELRALVSDMFETMYDAPGIGLAAIQVGVPKRVLVIDLQEPEEEGGEPVRDPRVFINPEIVGTSDQEVPYTEGCLLAGSSTIWTRARLRRRLEREGRLLEATMLRD